MTPQDSIIPAGWTAQIIGKNGSRYMILLRPGDHIETKESRLDDVAIIVDAEAGVREPPWFLQLYLKFDPGWEDAPHDPAMMAEFLGYPETPRAPGYEEEFKRMQEDLGRSR